MKHGGCLPVTATKETKKSPEADTQTITYQTSPWLALDPQEEGPRELYSPFS